ncbi:hypothetical protein [Rhodoferax sp. TS-BS-61-7]|uniref:hypothetical protein n=1 Tax=Rhodoferax sp. TS-BS-61-7 TaxID=2094194 RepID=UPI00191BE8EA|nr:hypothetical protein [Rhodoferax sp. TS-BS-61-7]
MEGKDKGLIASWLRGIEKAKEEPALAAKARAGELPPLPWKGGVERAIKGSKIGALHYLAAWQGLRGEDLDVDMNDEVSMTCTRTQVTVLFTGDLKKLLAETDSTK